MLSPRLQECLFYSREANNQTAMFSTQTRSLENASLGKLLWCQVSISRSPQRQNQGKDLRYNHGLGESWSWDISNLFCVPLTPCFSAHTHNSQGPCSAPALFLACWPTSVSQGFRRLYPWAPFSGGQLLGWPRRVPALGPQEMGFCFPVGRMETP